MDIVKQLRHVTGRPTECTPKITGAAADEIERLQLLVAKLNGGEELQTLMAEIQRLREALKRCRLASTCLSLTHTGLLNALDQVKEISEAALKEQSGA